MSPLDDSPVRAFSLPLLHSELGPLENAYAVQPGACTSLAAALENAGTVIGRAPAANNRKACANKGESSGEKCTALCENAKQEKGTAHLKTMTDQT